MNLFKLEIKKEHCPQMKGVSILLSIVQWNKSTASDNIDYSAKH